MRTETELHKFMDPPVKPDESDCCNSGCTPCVFDVYEEQLKKYNLSLLENKTPIASKNCINLLSYSVFKLVKLEQNTKLYTFEYVRPFKKKLPTKNLDNLKLLYEPGQHFLLKTPYKNAFTRAYTPIPIEGNSDQQFTVLIKLYDKGHMSNFIKTLKVGDETLWRGPYGNYLINYNFKNILFIAQGTGIAPLYAIIHKMLQNEDCYTFLKLYFCCRSDQDILLRNFLYELSTYWNFKYEVFLSSCDIVEEKYNEIIHKRRLNLEDIQSYIKDVSVDKLHILICGSDQFNTDMKFIVTNCNVSQDFVYTF